MPDKLTIEQRSRNMACIRGKDTKPEMIVRKFLWSRGFRYRLNHNRLPGKPDIVLRKYRTCIFVNGCFWHGHGIDFLSQFQVSSSKFQEVSGVSKFFLHYRYESGRAERQVDDNLQLDNLKDPETRHSILETLQSSECCKIPATRREFWVAKIMRNQQRDIEVQKKLAEMGWHCVTIWECQLSNKRVQSSLLELPSAEESQDAQQINLSHKTLREKTLESLEYTLNKIYLQDRRPLPAPLDGRAASRDVDGRDNKYELPEEERNLVAERCPNPDI